nr:methyltransferase domain-containing protein [Pseudofrankia asymbiotica]
MLSGPGADPELGDPEFRRPVAPTVVCEAPAGSDDPYWSFYDEVASVQLREWLPGAPSRVLDVSGQRDRFARQMVAAGHQVIRVVGDAAHVTSLPADLMDRRPSRSPDSQRTPQMTDLPTGLPDRFPRSGGDPGADPAGTLALGWEESWRRSGGGDGLRPPGRGPGSGSGRSGGDPMDLGGSGERTRDQVPSLGRGRPAPSPRAMTRTPSGARRTGEQSRGGPPGALRSVVGDARSLDWFAPASFDAVLAEGRALSFCLATESTLEEIHRLLRPGGQLLLCVDSLLLGLARLAEQHRWAELSDVPRADVVLVPAEDGTITRCFWPEELKAVLTSAGLEVDWVRPRTVLSVEAVKRALSTDMSSFPTLVRTEVELAAEREGESIGIHLIASARRPS